MAATCDGLRVRLVRDAEFNRAATRRTFVIRAGTVGTIVDNDATRAYTERAKQYKEDLIPVMLEGMVRYLPRAALELARDD
jgi:hypothetical protein